MSVTRFLELRPNETLKTKTELSYRNHDPEMFRLWSNVWDVACEPRTLDPISSTPVCGFKLQTLCTKRLRFPSALAPRNESLAEAFAATGLVILQLCDTFPRDYCPVTFPVPSMPCVTEGSRVQLDFSNEEECFLS